MLAVAARTGLALGDGQHRLHRDHHSGLKHGVDILAQLKPRLTTIVMRQHAEGMAIAKGTILQQIALGEEVVDLGRHLGARGAGLQKAHPPYSWAAIFASQILRLASSISPTNIVRSSAV